MEKRQMSGNDVTITDLSQLWYTDCTTEAELDAVEITKAHW